MQVLFEIMVQIKQKRGIGVENPSARSFSGGVSVLTIVVCVNVVRIQRIDTTTGSITQD